MNEWKMNARYGDRADAKKVKKAEPEHRRHQLGGPSVRKKTFFFGNLQLLRVSRFREALWTVSTSFCLEWWSGGYVAGGRNQLFPE